jgi:hypothetical protein
MIVNAPQDWKAFTISFSTQQWGGRPPQASDLLTTTMSMFDQIKSEPLHFYQTGTVLQQNQVQNHHGTVIAVHDEKDNLQVVR